MKIKYRHKFSAVFVIVTVILVILAALLGYHLTKRYQETITDTYHTAVSNISERLESLQGDVVNEISKLEQDQE